MITTVDAQRFMLLFKGKTNTYVKNELPKEKPVVGEKIKTKITNNEGKVDKEFNEMINKLKRGIDFAVYKDSFIFV